MKDSSFRDLRSPRLLIRRLDQGDADALAAYRSDADVARYQDWDTPYTRSAAEAAIERLQDIDPGTPGSWFQFGVVLRTSAALIGDVGLYCAADSRVGELGFTFGAAHHGQGFASEAVRAVMEYAFDTLSLPRLMARVDARNLPAQRLLERLGFHRDSMLDEPVVFKGTWTTERFYARLKSD